MSRAAEVLWGACAVAHDIAAELAAAQLDAAGQESVVNPRGEGAN